MSNDDLTIALSRLSTVLEQKFGIDPAEVTPDAGLEELELDSLALVELSLSLQKAYQVVIATEDLTPNDTIGDLAKLFVAASAQA